MSESILIRYWLNTDSFFKIRTLEISYPDSDIIDLKKLILARVKEIVGDLRWHSLDFWKVNIPRSKVKSVLRSLKLNDDDSLDETALITDYFPERPDLDHLDIIVRYPPPICYGLPGDPDTMLLKIDYQIFDVQDLKMAIMEAHPFRFQDVDITDVELWKVSIPKDHITGPIDSIEYKHGKILSNRLSLLKVYPKPPEPNCLHIIVRIADKDSATEPSNSTKGLEHVTERFAELNTVMKLSSTMTPNVEKCQVYKTPEEKNPPIINGRYDFEHGCIVVGVPIQLFHPVFGHFLDNISNEHLQIPDETLRNTVEYIHAASSIYDDYGRETILGPILSKLLGITIGPFRPDIPCPDRIVQCTNKDLLNIAAPMMMKAKRGMGGSVAASVQVCYSMARYWCLPERSKLRHRTCCPTFLIASCGPLFAILGGVCGDYAIFQRLTDFIWIGANTALEDHHYHRVARIFVALKEGINSLTRYYEGIKPSDPGRLGFEPSINVYMHDGQLVYFKYITRLEPDTPACVTFLAETLETAPKKIVVKFVERYGDEAHRYLANAGFAPELYYYGRVGVQDGDPTYGNLRMVIMEYIEGSTVDRLYHRAPLPENVKSGIKEAIERLHEGGYVFGDLRRPNIMISSDGAVKLIDFDWAGTYGETRHPLSISPVMKWPDGVKGLVKIEQEHDLEMLERISADPTSHQ